MRLRGFFCSSILCLLFLSVNVSDVRAFNEEFSTLDRTAVIQASKSVSSLEFPDADEVLLDDYTRVEYKPDGTSLEFCDSYKKILTEKGRRQNKELTLYYTIPYDRVEVLLLEVIKSDGTVFSVDIESQSNVMVDPSQMGSNIYNPNDKILKVSIPDLQVGDIVHSVTKSETVKAIVPNTWSAISIFEYTSPIKHHVYEVISPDTLPLKKKLLKDEITGTVVATEKKLPDSTIYRWEVSDVPQMFPEPDMPSLVAVVQRLLVSTVENWEEISKWYWQLSEKPLAAVTPEMKEKVAELTKGISDPYKKMEVIFRWVSQEVRYLGITIEKEAPGFEPHDVNLTFEQRHGVCRDKAALLVAMLRLAGLDAFPVLIYVGTKRDPEVPMSRFNHAIVAVELKNSKTGQVETVLMDPTNESTKDIFPAYLNNRSYLIAKKDGATLQVSPIISAQENIVDIKTQAEVNANARLTVKSVFNFKGINDSAYRGFFARASQEERWQFFETIVKNIASGAVLDSLEITPSNLLNTEQPLSVSVSFSAEDVLASQDGYSMFIPPFFGTSIGLVNFALGKTGLEKRKYPLNLDYACGVTEDLGISIDPSIGKVVSYPDVNKIENELITWKGSVRIDDEQITLKRDFFLNSVEFSPKDYLVLREDLKKIEYDKRKKIIFEYDADDFRNEDVVVLDRTVDIKLIDSQNWSEEHFYRKKILSYKGKKDASEVKISFNTSLETVKLLGARVINGEQIKEVAENEINVMDASWVASAPRYPASKTMVVSLPSVEIGSIVEYRFLIEKRNMPFFSTMQIFRDLSPLKSKSVKIEAPKDLVFSVKSDDNGIVIPDDLIEKDSLSFSEYFVDDKRVMNWYVDEQQPIRQESNLPPAFTMTTMLYVKSGNDKDFTAQLFEDLEAKTRNQVKSEALAKSLVEKNDSQESKAIKIRDYVAKNIKRIGPDLTVMDRTAFTNADRTLIEGYGNNTDNAILIYTMLKAVGFNPSFILVDSALEAKTVSEFKKENLLLTTFDKVLVQIVINGELILLNDTNQYAQLGTTPSDGHLFLEKNGTKGIVTVDEELQTTTEANYVLSIDNNGNAKLNVEKLYYGGDYSLAKQLFSEMTPEEKRRYYQEQIAELSQAAKPLTALNLSFDSYPGKEYFSVEIPDFAIVSNKEMYFDLPRTIGGLVGINSSRRVNPFSQSANSRTFVKNTIKLPEKFRDVKISPTPLDFDLPNNAGHVESSVKYLGDSIEVIQKIDLFPTIIQAYDYVELLNIERKLSHQSNRSVLLVSEDE